MTKPRSVVVAFFFPAFSHIFSLFQQTKAAAIKLGLDPDVEHSAEAVREAVISKLRNMKDFTRRNYRLAKLLSGPNATLEQLKEARDCLELISRGTKTNEKLWSASRTSFERFLNLSLFTEKEEK